ncbi:MAG: hypothetical protein MUO58_08010 [Anaerolineales bacterium]|nr:hypothetical protein [Anaerolineales bacterium]
MVSDVELKPLELLFTHSEYRQVFYKILHFCMEPKSFMEVHDEIQSYPEIVTSLQPPNILLGWLEKAGGIEQITEEQEGKWETTEAGNQVAAQEMPTKKIQKLLFEETDLREIFLDVIDFCTTPRTLQEIKEEFKGRSILDERNVHPTYFIHTLEEFGGLVWEEKRWRTTDAGKGVLIEENS